MLVLGIETSCDDTSASVVEDGLHVRSNIIGTQLEVHAPYGGVVPEIAARAHLEAITPVLDAALDEAGVRWGDLDAIAATQGPGLVGPLLIGLGAGKAIAGARDLPFIGVHHIEGHVCATQLEFGHLNPPLLALVVSGGHTSLIHVHPDGTMESVGATIDDAAGEAFDKIARFLGLGFPGGPLIDKLGASGNPQAIAFPRPKLHDHDLNFSMSGLKTAVIRELRRREAAGEQIDLPDVAASFNQAIVDVLVHKTMKAADQFDVGTIALVGGVAANRPLRADLAAACAASDRKLLAPSPALCTDNGAMIAAAGTNRLLHGEQSGLDLDADPNLPLVNLVVGGSQ
ncbi:tRNA (adenosine(37)-N6)-threonylcarbamoyltransferase complex transferase subunit TsaD [Stomatohabitans albus]|uniref:tRNA (adenosine(37)-N6)-threonylcarbamoyltransferase complex transferase subunit TsaD n=1 Tax=Stomatohabitans albus TaxID=3110766 RepID=UPI00300C6846